jgi:hypothetical protein
MIRLHVCGGAGLAPAAGLIRSLSAFGRDSSQSCRCGVPCTQTGATGPYDKPDWPFGFWPLTVTAISP